MTIVSSYGFQVLEVVTVVVVLAAVVFAIAVAVVRLAAGRRE
jgi:hypothetical protein